MSEGRVMMDAKAMNRALSRIASQIIERNRGFERLMLIGVRARGDYIAKRLAVIIEKVEGAAGGARLPIGALDITMYRDDIELNRPEVRASEIPGSSIADHTVVLVDDVLFTGRTARAALDALMGYGRPRSIQLAVLIDRQGHRELPIHADYAGITIDTRRDNKIVVNMDEDGKDDSVLVK